MHLDVRLSQLSSRLARQYAEEFKISHQEAISEMLCEAIVSQMNLTGNGALSKASVEKITSEKLYAYLELLALVNDLTVGEAAGSLIDHWTTGIAIETAREAFGALAAIKTSPTGQAKA